MDLNEEARQGQVLKVRSWLQSLSDRTENALSSRLESAYSLSATQNTPLVGDESDDLGPHAETRPEDPIGLFYFDDDWEEVSVRSLSETYSERQLDLNGRRKDYAISDDDSTSTVDKATGDQKDSTKRPRQNDPNNRIAEGELAHFDSRKYQIIPGEGQRLVPTKQKAFVSIAIKLPPMEGSMEYRKKRAYDIECPYVWVPPVRPTLLRNKPLRLSLPGRPACYIFPSFERSYISTLTASDGSVDGTVATMSTTFYTALSVRSGITASTATFFTAPTIGSRSGLVITEASRPVALEESEYFKLLVSRRLIHPTSEEKDWSGQGQHPEFSERQTPPLKVIGYIGASKSALVEKVRCRRILLARKMMKCWRRWTLEDALREVEHLNKLRHAHIVQLVGTYRQSRIFAVLLYPAADCDLSTFLSDTANLNVLPPASASSIHGNHQSSLNSDELEDLQKREESLNACFACLASALAYIHSSTIKHLDIKPANILMKKSPKSIRRTGDPEHRVYVADFGLSRDFQGQDCSQSEERVGYTPKYCAPEVHHGLPCGRSVDIFSLGCVYLEILTVLSGTDLEDFVDFRRGHGGVDASYHAHLPEVGEWLTRLKNKALKREEDPMAYLRMSSYLYGMLSNLPETRPTAEQLVKFFSGESLYHTLPAKFRARTCCLRAPEPYVIE